MTDDSADMTDSLTGVWNGLFNHPNHAPVSFLATLIEAGDSISGTTTEACAARFCPRKTHNALLDGHRRRSAVAFIKTYDPKGFGYGVVEYQGRVNADATEIDGEWKIPGTALAGKFLMIRAGSAKQELAEKVTEKA